MTLTPRMPLRVGLEISEIMTPFNVELLRLISHVVDVVMYVVLVKLVMTYLHARLSHFGSEPSIIQERAQEEEEK